MLQIPRKCFESVLQISLSLQVERSRSDDKHTITSCELPILALDEGKISIDIISDISVSSKTFDQSLPHYPFYHGK